MVPYFRQAHHNAEQRPKLSGPVSRDTARLSQRYPPIARYGVFGVSTWPIGCETPSPFLSVSPLESMRSGGAIPPPSNFKGVSQRYLHDTVWKQGKTRVIPPSEILSRKGGVSRTGPLRAQNGPARGFLNDPFPLRDGETTLKIKFGIFEGWAGGGGRDENCPITFLGETTQYYKIKFGKCKLYCLEFCCHCQAPNPPKPSFSQQNPKGYQNGWFSNWQVLWASKTRHFGTRLFWYQFWFLTSAAAKCVTIMLQCRPNNNHHNNNHPLPNNPFWDRSKNLANKENIMQVKWGVRIGGSFWTPSHWKKKHAWPRSHAIFCS